jgi:hypothetical protein
VGERGGHVESLRQRKVEREEEKASMSSPSKTAPVVEWIKNWLSFYINRALLHEISKMRRTCPTGIGPSSTASEETASSGAWELVLLRYGLQSDFVQTHSAQLGQIPVHFQRAGFLNSHSSILNHGFRCRES